MTNRMHASQEEKFNAFFIQESLRKESLMNLFEKLEEKELKGTRPKKGQEKYSRVFRGVVMVNRIADGKLFLEDIQGEDMGVLEVTPEICSFMRLGDQLDAMMGLRGKEWRMLYLAFIISQMQPEDLH